MNKRVPTETVIDILKNYKEYIEPQQEESLELAYAIQRGIESLKEDKRSRWIPIDKQLPTEKDADMDGLILIKLKTGRVREATWSHIANRECLRDCEISGQGKVIGWARMPEVEDP